MSSVWNKFIAGYCKVDFLCVNSDPNWLGWIPLIGIGIVVSLSIIGIILSAIEQEITIRKLDAINKREKLEIADTEGT